MTAEQASKTLMQEPTPRDFGEGRSRWNSKTNVPEMGFGSQSYNPVFGTTLNAYDQTKCAGGSSGGAAVSLALHMQPVADGSDMMGSLRNPAAFNFNNVLGFRTSYGRAPAADAEMFLHTLSVNGSMGRSASDVAPGVQG